MSSSNKQFSSIVKKVLMAASGLFLMFFLVQHLSINMMSVVSEDLFNQVSHFMGTNPVVQGILQPVLIIAVVFHFVWGFVLDIQNRNARKVKYAMYKGEANASWVSRNMIISGSVILAFLALHFYDFWIPEMNIKYVQGDMSGLHHGTSDFRYYDELVQKFAGQPVRLILYVISFVLLALHLSHGFQSAFQSVGVNNPRITPILKKAGLVFSILVPLGFIFIAMFHYTSNL
jgi:succinate dehydrogenase / fumarate reductase cytochrome b subunit